MKTRIPIEVVVGLLAGVSCLVTISGIGFPVWALFIGWAWYFALGATPSVLKKIYPSMIPGTILAGLGIWLIGLFADLGLEGLPGMIVAVIITVFLLMLALKIPLTNSSLPAFNAYSTVFALFATGAFPDLAIGQVGSCMLWALIGNALGPLFGYLSIKLTFPIKKKEEVKESQSVH